MIAEATMLTLLKGTLTTGGSASFVALVEGRWWLAVAAAPPLFMCALNLRHRSRRLRGKRAEGPP